MLRLVWRSRISSVRAVFGWEEGGLGSRRDAISAVYLSKTRAERSMPVDVMIIGMMLHGTSRPRLFPNFGVGFWTHLGISQQKSNQSVTPATLVIPWSALGRVTHSDALILRHHPPELNHTPLHPPNSSSLNPLLPFQLFWIKSVSVSREPCRIRLICWPPLKKGFLVSAAEPRRLRGGGWKRRRTKDLAYWSVSVRTAT
ncbi:hypothetical protein L209DRAFT_164445 [Thermothelomyces heterothallicus CBS 203.75]